MDNNAIPMSMSQATIAPPSEQGIDSRIPLQVQAPGPIDGAKPLPDGTKIVKSFEDSRQASQQSDLNQQESQLNTYKLRDAELSSQVKEQSAKDEATVTAWRQTHPDKSFRDPENLKLAQQELAGKVSAATLDHFDKLYNASIDDQTKTMENMDKMGAIKLAEHNADMGRKVDYLVSPALKAYNDAKAAGMSDVDAQTAFRTAKQSAVEIVKNDTRPEMQALLKDPKANQVYMDASPEVI